MVGDVDYLVPRRNLQGCHRLTRVSMCCSYNTLMSSYSKAMRNCTLPSDPKADPMLEDSG